MSEFITKIVGISKSFLSVGRAVLAGGAGLAIAVLAFILRRRTEELRESRAEATEQKDNAENQKVRDEMACLEAKVEADEKDRLRKKVLLANLLDDGRDRGPRDK